MPIPFRDSVVSLIGRFPFLDNALRYGVRLISGDHKEVGFKSTTDYWDSRYRRGGNSGAGSYGRLARFKADTINRFVDENSVTSVVEFGCGDGAQLALSRYPQYIGVDISPRIIEICRRQFKDDADKQFFVSSDRNVEAISADLALSLDVIYHLVEDELYQDYMQRLVSAAGRFICVYSSNMEKAGHVSHIRHHCVTDWFTEHASSWKLKSKVANPYPMDPEDPDETSWADFYFYAREV